MSYLKFDKTLLTNLEQSLPIEYLRTNKSDDTTYGNNESCHCW